jgi:starch synthase
VARFTEQKGIKLVLENRDFFVGSDCRLVVLGAGDKALEAAMHALAAESPEKISLSARLDEAMSHLIEAGSDFFVMPSLFEPCGLNQMYSQVYGTVPIVSRVGGLADTVIDVDEQPYAGTGLMCAPNAGSLREALERSQKLFSDKPRHLATQQRGMARDFGWASAAKGYEKLYSDSL